jgi:hypothetical protein
MAAILQLFQRYGSSPGTVDGPITSVSLLSIDSDGNTVGERVAAPIAAGSRSYSRWVFLRITQAPDNQISNVRLWCDDTPDANLTYFVGFTGTYATPTNSDSPGSPVDVTSYPSGSKATWDAGPYTSVNDETDYAVFYLSAGASAAAGNASAMTINYSWDEV